MTFRERVVSLVVVVMLGFALVVAFQYGRGSVGDPAPAPTPTAEPQGLTAEPIQPLDDCRPCDNDARLTCCYPLNTVELDDASKRVLNFAFNLEGVVGEHDRLLQAMADRLRLIDRRYVDLDARLAKLEEQVRDLALDVRELQRARKRRR